MNDVVTVRLGASVAGLSPPEQSFSPTTTVSPVNSLPPFLSLPEEKTNILQASMTVGVVREPASDAVHPPSPFAASLDPTPSCLPKKCDEELESMAEEDGEALENRGRQREKQLRFGQATPGYLNMLRLTKHDALLKEGGILPLAPPSCESGSKRAWDIQFRRWRRALHMFDYVFIDGEDPEEMWEECLEAQRKQWVSAAFAGTPKSQRFRLTTQEMMAARSGRVETRQLPLEPNLTCLLRCADGYKSIKNVLSSHTSSITKGTEISPLLAGIKVHIAPSSALVQQQSKQRDELTSMIEKVRIRLKNKAEASEKSPSPKRPGVIDVAGSGGEEERDVVGEKVAQKEIINTVRFQSWPAAPKKSTVAMKRGSTQHHTNGKSCEVDPISRSQSIAGLSATPDGNGVEFSSVRLSSSSPSPHPPSGCIFTDPRNMMYTQHGQPAFMVNPFNPHLGEGGMSISVSSPTYHPYTYGNGTPHSWSPQPMCINQPFMMPLTMNPGCVSGMSPLPGTPSPVMHVSNDFSMGGSYAAIAVYPGSYSGTISLPLPAPSIPLGSYPQNVIPTRNKGEKFSSAALNP